MLTPRTVIYRSVFRMLPRVTRWLCSLPLRPRSFTTRNTGRKHLTCHISRGISQERRQREFLSTGRATFFIHDDVKWVGMFGCGVELGLDVGGGGTLGEKFASLNNYRAAPVA
jgi:hypothetical protein